MMELSHDLSHSVADLQARLQSVLGDAYHIERELGGGGMSRLFLATEASLHRQVVIKLLPPEFASEVSATRFRQEIGVAAHLQHTNILPVLTAGAKDDLLFYVMPFVSGESLRHRLTREGRLPLPDAMRILHEIADALAHAHAEGVIHRDIKPENILLLGSHAVLTDFGVARALAESRSGDRLTDTGLALGTPGYMSPEQAAGERNVDARADIYALAVVGYEMLAGFPPFAGPTAQAVIAAHLTATPKPLTEVRPETPPEVAKAIARALAKDPNARLRTSAEFRDAFGPAPGRASPRRLSKQARITIGIMAAALVAGAAALLLRPKALLSLDPDLLAVAPFDVLAPNLELWHEGLVDILSRNLDGAGPLRTVSPSVVVRRWSGRADPPSATEAARASLPEPVQRWLRSSGVVDRQRPRAVRRRYEGDFRLGEDKDWLPFTSQTVHGYLGNEGPLQALGWQPVAPAPGQPLAEVQPLFRKLDPASVEEEVARLGA